MFRFYYLTYKLGLTGKTFQGETKDATPLLFEEEDREKVLNDYVEALLPEWDEVAVYAVDIRSESDWQHVYDDNFYNALMENNSFKTVMKCQQAKEFIRNGIKLAQFEGMDIVYPNHKDVTTYAVIDPKNVKIGKLIKYVALDN